MKAQRQKDRVLALLQTGEDIKETQLGNLGKFYSYSYRRWIHELRSEGYDIRCTIRIDGTYYTLIKEGENDGRNSNELTRLQAA